MKYLNSHKRISSLNVLTVIVIYNEIEFLKVFPMKENVSENASV